jgi:diacylglycerol kinase (ATP)
LTPNNHSILIILIVEALNTGLEKAIDRISYEYHDLSGLAKDCGSATVFLSFALAGLVWAVVLLD